jgi:hypothetical protein
VDRQIAFSMVLVAREELAKSIDKVRTPTKDIFSSDFFTRHSLGGYKELEPFKHMDIDELPTRRETLFEI